MKQYEFVTVVLPMTPSGFQLVHLDLFDERGAGDTELAGRVRTVPLAPPQHAIHMPALHLCER